MGQLMGLMRSFGPTMEAVFERWDAAAALVGLVDDADEFAARITTARVSLLDLLELHATPEDVLGPL